MTVGCLRSFEGQRTVVTHVILKAIREQCSSEIVPLEAILFHTSVNCSTQIFYG